MVIGDFLEWLAAALITTSAYLWSGTVLALAVAGLFVGYFAQCYSSLKIQRWPKIRRRWRRAHRVGSSGNTFHCGKCGGAFPHGDTHTCLSGERVSSL